MNKKTLDNFKCIKMLDENKERFLAIAEHYSKDLSQDIKIEESLYTLHDFDHHCLDIYKIISDVLLEPVWCYENRQASGCGLTEKELYILDLAVLFHDISMSRDITAERSNHSKKSADYVEKLYENHESVLYKEGGLSRNDITALKAVIKAHSDVKDGSVPEKARGLKDPELTDGRRTGAGGIRAKLLAGILRLADELDITSDRLGNTDIEARLREAEGEYADLMSQKESGDGGGFEKKRWRYEEYVKSLRHWENLHLFSAVYRESQSATVYIKTDDHYLRQKIEEGGSAAALAERINTAYKKVKSEWDSIKKVIIDDSDEMVNRRSMIPISEIQIECETDAVRQELERLRENSEVSAPFRETEKATACQGGKTSVPVPARDANSGVKKEGGNSGASEPETSSESKGKFGSDLNPPEKITADLREKAKTDPICAFQLAMACFRSDSEKEPDMEAVRNCLLYAWKKGNSEIRSAAANALGDLCFRGKDYADSAKWYARSVFGDGFREESTEADWKILPDRGSSWGLYNLGYAFYCGYGVNRDLSAAKRCFEKSGYAGNAYGKWVMKALQAGKYLVEDDEMCGKRGNTQEKKGF